MAEASADVMPAKKHALIFSGFVVVAALACVLLVGGHPHSNWFYPFVVAIAIFSWFRRMRRGDRPMTMDGDVPPKSFNTALLGASIAFILTAAGLYVGVNLLSPAMWSWPVDGFLSAMIAVNLFRQKRGYAYSMWPALILFVGFLAVLFIFKRA